MNDLSQIQRDLPEVSNIGLSATKYFDGGGNGLLSICGWSQDLTTEADIALTIVDETDHLEWTCMIRSTLNTRPSPESFQVKIPRSSVSHRLVVTVQVLRKILSIDTVTSDFERRKITAVCSRKAMFVVRANALPSLFPDVICPKIAIDPRDPYGLRVELMRIVDKVVLTFTTAYEEIYCWRVSFAVAGALTCNGGYVFLYFGDGISQRFEIPFTIFEVGLSYGVTVEGLQLIDGIFDDSCGNFRIAYCRTVCRNFVLLPVSQDDDDLRIQIHRSKFHQASVLIATSIPQRANQKLKISIQKTERFYTHEQECSDWTIGSCQRFDFPVELDPGHRYQVMVELIGDKSVRRTATFRAELTIEDITTLYHIAVGHAAGYSSFPCEWLYRNKSQEYFQNILQNRGGIMEVYDKDNSGDPASPINLQIKGLFFMASVWNRTGQLPTHSPFGPTRICIPANDVLRKVVVRLYFVDYYCMKGKSHYVTLVITKSDSETDKFCAKRLLELSVDGSSGNPFLFYDEDGQLNVSAADDLWVELLLTENINITCSQYKLQHGIPLLGTGSSKPEGIPKSRNCARCNLSLIYNRAPMS